MYKEYKLESDHYDGCVWIEEQFRTLIVPGQVDQSYWYEINRVPVGYEGAYSDGIMDGRVYMKSNTIWNAQWVFGKNVTLL